MKEQFRAIYKGEQSDTEFSERLARLARIRILANLKRRSPEQEIELLMDQHEEILADRNQCLEVIAWHQEFIHRFQGYLAEFQFELRQSRDLIESAYV